MNICWWATRKKRQGECKFSPFIQQFVVADAHAREWSNSRLSLPSKLQPISTGNNPSPKFLTASVCFVHMTTSALNVLAFGLYSEYSYSTMAKRLRNKNQLQEEVEDEKQVLSSSKNIIRDFEQDTYRIVALLRVCAKQKDLHRGSKIHAEIAERGLLKQNIALGNTLISMYAKCGALVKAQSVFDELPVRNVVSWTVLIDGYAQHGHGEKALNYFDKMQHAGLSPNAVTFTCILKACGSIGAVDRGKEIHNWIMREGLLEKDILIANSLVDMYAKCGALAQAREVFDKLPVKTVILWTALLAGYTQHGHAEEALKCFETMQHRGVAPNVVTFVCALKACGSIGACGKGQEIHTQIDKEGLMEHNAMVGNALVDMYAKCGSFRKAHEVFDKLRIRNVVSWTALISGYVKHGRGQVALDCFERMQFEHVALNTVTFVCVLKACARTRSLDKGKEIHTRICRDGLLEKDILLGIALVDMYAKCGMLANAQDVFDELLVKNVALWTTLIAGYVGNGFGGEAIYRFEEMLREGLFPNMALYSCILKACGSEGAACKGQELHATIEREGLLEKDLVVATALVDMYAKCGFLEKAQDVFDRLPGRDVSAWNSLMGGHAHYGKHKNVLKLFNQMIGEGAMPNRITFSIMLLTCSIGGLLEEGQLYFEALRRDYGITPTLGHHNYMVDLFGRAGRYDKSIAIMNDMPFFTYLMMSHTLLDAY